VIDALDGLEKIDVIQWSPDPIRLITNALSPAKNLAVEIDEKQKTAKVRAPKEELPLIIGREGQNVRLASKLTEYNIEVEGDESMSVPVAEGKEETKKPEGTKAESGEAPKEAASAEEGTHEKKEASDQDSPQVQPAADSSLTKPQTESPAEETAVPEVVTEEPVSAAPMHPETEKIVEPRTSEETKPE
jgi:N utilization substance protein A